MGRTANLSIAGIYEWDNTIFDLLEIPNTLNRDTLIKTILAKTMELETIYPNPTVLKNLIGVWSKSQVDVWAHLVETTHYEYNPIENYDRHEESTDTTTHGGTDTATSTRTDGHWIAGFNSTASGTNDGLVKQTRDESGITGSNTYGATEDREHTLHIHGNIGVTSSQDMIKQEREIAMFNPYDLISDEFKFRFCVLVY